MHGLVAAARHRTCAFIGLERTTKGAEAGFDITEPAKRRFVAMIITDGDVAPEGLAAYHDRGEDCLDIANEVSITTTLYRVDRKAHKPAW